MKKFDLLPVWYLMCFNYFFSYFRTSISRSGLRRIFALLPTRDRFRCEKMCERLPGRILHHSQRSYRSSPSVGYSPWSGTVARSMEIRSWSILTRKQIEYKKAVALSIWNRTKNLHWRAIRQARSKTGYIQIVEEIYVRSLWKNWRPSTACLSNGHN